LSFIWPGAGHLYIGDNEPGIILTILSFVVLIINLTIIGLIIGIPAYVGMAAFSMIDTNKKGKFYNAQRGFA
jgi:TM2 domain-containing membrane protein YozV